MSVVGIGIDTVEIERFRRIAEEKGERFLEKIFTSGEMKYAESKKARFIHMAGKFAAKEAVKKALPNGAEIGLNWPEIEILNTKDGKPYVRLHGQAGKLAEEFKLTKVLVSISHTRGIATSNAVVIKDGA